MEELYFTIAGCSHYFGSDFMEKGMKVKLEKELDNEYDKEAIQVKIPVEQRQFLMKSFDFMIEQALRSA